MTGIVRKQFILPLIILLLGLFFTNKVNAATLANVSDIISTSRPSASAPLATNQAASATQVVVTSFPAGANNSTSWLASDSAVLNFDTGQTLNTVTIASTSAEGVPAANQKTLYFTNTAANAHHQGTAVFTSITATHTIKFTTISGIPGSGHIIIDFPGTGSNIASPSATTFAFNNISSSQITTNNATCSSWSITAPRLDCTLNASGVAGSTTVTIILGCTTGTTACTVFSPRLINPIKGATAAGSADTWKVTISTTDTTANGGTVLDTGSAKIATVEAVQVQGTVEPTLTFTISGTTDGSDVTSAASGCGTSIVSNAGIDTTATFVNLGILSNGRLNKAIQRLRVSTNGSTGYSITATSSGRFINPASGFFFADANSGNGLTANDTPVPAVIEVAAPTAAKFGIHPCGSRVAAVGSDQWVNAGTAPNTTDGTAKFSNPWNTGTSGFYNTIATYTAGPVTNDDTAILYAATVLGSTPAGIYGNYYTYVATATF